MSSCRGSVPQEARPGSARVRVTELSRSGQVNPAPATKPCNHSESAVELSCLSPDKLKLLCGTGDLSHVKSLEICVDTRENTLGNFGTFLPRLVQLRLNNSLIQSIRDLGSTLSHLQVLWMPRCSLQGLEGISTFSSLKELYVSYNSVSDLSQIGMLENLELLDLEGNDVIDLVQVQYLGLCGKLHTLTLEGNPVCVRPNPTAVQTADYRYRAAVRELVPQLRYLDDLRVDEDGRCCSSTMGEDWVILQKSIRDCSSSQAVTEDEEKEVGACQYSRNTTAGLPPSSTSFVWPLSVASSRPQTAPRPAVLSPPGSRPGSADSDVATVAVETSFLTHGAGKILFCGNPVQALRARREKLRTAPTRSTFTPRELPIHVPEHTYDLEETNARERADVFAELRAWREQHNRCLQAIETEKLPQVLTIQHSDEDEGEAPDEEEDFAGVRTDSSDEEYEEENHGESQESASPDSSFESLSPDWVPSPDVAQLSCSLETVLSPSPCIRATGANHRLPGIRARRLHLGQTSLERGRDCTRSSGTEKFTGDTDLRLHRVRQLARSNVPVLSLPAHIPRPPPKNSPGEGKTDHNSAEMDPSCPQPARKHLQTLQMSKLKGVQVMSRPHTAMAALQKHHPRHMPQPCRGRSQPK